MELNPGQIRGMIAIVTGFLITILAGILLSIMAVNQLTPSQTVMIAVIVFMAVVPVFGYGVYTYARSTEAEAYETNDDMEKPRLLLDILREEDHGDIVVLAARLETTPAEIHTYIDDLSHLQLFSGIADWENGVIAMMQPAVIRAIESCRTCNTPIKIDGTITICAKCRTRYYTL